MIVGVDIRLLTRDLNLVLEKDSGFQVLDDDLRAKLLSGWSKLSQTNPGVSRCLQELSQLLCEPKFSSEAAHS